MSKYCSHSESAVRLRHLMFNFMETDARENESEENTLRSVQTPSANPLTPIIITFYSSSPSPPMI